MGEYQRQYDLLWERLRGSDSSFHQAVGGDFVTVGLLEFSLLKSLGLRPDHRVIDVGCGSGRLAAWLAGYLAAASEGYLGTDILPPLLAHARDISRRPDWRFELTDGQSVPAADASADFVCFFSVMTHLTHEETWQYILEARRVLRPGGLLVASFLEFRIRGHWPIFWNTFVDKSPDKILNQFLSRDAFEAFALNAALDVVSFHDGDRPHIPIEEEVVWENGIRMSGLANLGQSVCVLRKRVEDRPPPV